MELDEAPFSLYDLQDFSDTTVGALLKAAENGGSPFDCIDRPADCPAIPTFLPRLEEFHRQYAFDVEVPDRMNTPRTLLSGLGVGLCVYRTGMSYIEEGIKEMVAPLKEMTKTMSQGPSALDDEAENLPPACDEEKAPFCILATHRSTSIYRSVLFPAFYLHFWSLGSPPILNPCGGLMQPKFIVPGLFSEYAMQSSTFLKHKWEYRLLFKCNVFAHIMAFTYAVPQTSSSYPECDTVVPTLIASVDPWGSVKAIHEIYAPRLSTGYIEPYGGGFTGLAVSTDDSAVWACGRWRRETGWHLFSFRLSDFDHGLGPAENGRYNQHTRTACYVKPLPASFQPPSCTLTWDKSKRWLWFGSLAQPDEFSQFMGYDVGTVPGDGSCSTIGSVRSTMQAGEHVTAFSFMTDLLGDDYVAIARCDPLLKGNQPCKAEFYETTRSRSGLDLTTKDPISKIRVPSGISSLTHDTSLGVQAVGGGFIHVAFNGMTTLNSDATEGANGDPEVCLRP